MKIKTIAPFFFLPTGKSLRVGGSPLKNIELNDVMIMPGLASTT